MDTRQCKSNDEFGCLDNWHRGYFVQYNLRRWEFEFWNRREHRPGWHNYGSYKWFDGVARGTRGGRIPTGFLLSVRANSDESR